MGIFGTDHSRQTSGGYANDVVTTDGFLPQQNADDQAMQQSVNNLIEQSPPQSPAQDDQTGFLLADEPDFAHHKQAPAPAPTPSAVPVAVHQTPPAPTPAPPPVPVHPAPTHGPVNDLADIKQQALQQLTPLVGHLDQSPEERFHTTMMMLQATDDQSLVKTAYEAAQSITDERIRAQALLDIVNEINYFTQQQRT